MTKERVLEEAVSILNASADTVRIVRNTLLAIRERGMRFSDAEAAEDFSRVCEVLHMMEQGIPAKLAVALLEEEARQNTRPSTTFH